jgi:hypothetical protein
MGKLSILRPIQDNSEHVSDDAALQKLSVQTYQFNFFIVGGRIDIVITGNFIVLIASYSYKKWTVQWLIFHVKGDTV